MLITTSYTEQIVRLPKNGRHIIAQFVDFDRLIVPSESIYPLTIGRDRSP